MFLNLLRATRLERALIPLSFIFLTLSFATQVTTQVIILATCSTLLYISGGLLNAKIDKDYPLPKRTPMIITILILTTIILSFQNKIIFIAVLSWVVLNIIYNKYSRKILFADSLILSITHAGIPVVATAFLSGLSIFLTTKIAIFSISLATFLIPMKNLKGVKEDRERNYKTILTKWKNGKIITMILFNLSFFLMISAAFFFYLDHKYMIALIPIMAVYLTTNCLLLIKKEKIAYEFSRLIPIFISLVFTYYMNSSIKIIFANISLVIIYATYLIFNTKWNTTML